MQAGPTTSRAAEGVLVDLTPHRGALQPASDHTRLPLRFAFPRAPADGRTATNCGSATLVTLVDSRSKSTHTDDPSSARAERRGASRRRQTTSPEGEERRLGTRPYACGRSGSVACGDVDEERVFSGGREVVVLAAHLDVGETGPFDHHHEFGAEVQVGGEPVALFGDQ